MRPKILELNGYKLADYSKDKAQKILEHLLQESETCYGHKREKTDGPIEEMNRWFYRTLPEVENSRTSTEKENLELSSQLSTKQLQMLKGDGEINIKYEFPRRQELKTLVKQTLALIKKLETKNSELQNLLVEVLDSKLAKTSQSDDLKKTVEELDKYLKSIRKYSVLTDKKVNGTEMSEPDCEKELQVIKTWLDSAQVHLDGSTAFQKRAKAWLS